MREKAVKKAALSFPLKLFGAGVAISTDEAITRIDDGESPNAIYRVHTSVVPDTEGGIRFV